MSWHKMKRKGLPLVICAPSGAGKSTLISMLRREFDLQFSISCTTRAPREGEQDGRDYFFIGKEDFEARREEGFFAEWAEVHGNYYGTPIGAVQQKLDEGCDIVFDIDVQGAAQLRLSLPLARFAFILPPSLEELERRLRLRGTESEASLQTRLSNARSEIMQCHWFDALIVNDDLEEAYAELRSFYAASTLSPKLCPGAARRICGS